MHPLTAAHVTHEALDKIGGIGTVLEGIITSPVYQRHVKRSILVGPYINHLAANAEQRLGDDGTVLYSSIDKIDRANLSGKFHPIEWAFNVAIVYGKRRFVLPGSEDHVGEAEILLIDIYNANTQRLSQFKWRLAEVFGLDSRRYEADWAYEEYVRLAEPAFYALLALLRDDELPCILFAHEFMGLPAAFKAVLDGEAQFRTVFHAHECGTARNLVESHPGHDTAFYNILHQAQAAGAEKKYVDEIFGDQSGGLRHALVSRAHLCDAIIAVGDYTAQEIHFLGSHFDHHHIDIVYNGVPPLKVTFDAVKRSRAMLAEYAERLIGWRPDVLMTHVMRPVISKGLWRDFQVCHELDRRLSERKRRGALFILTTGGGTRRHQDVLVMEQEYGWPRKHRDGYPDLVGPETEFNRLVEEFNASHASIQAVLVNQFGWSRERLGNRLPAEMTFADLRRAADIEFGMATYEPFGISPLEPLGAGAICVVSNVCGCCGLVNEAAGGEGVPNVLVGDYTQLDREWSIPELLGMNPGDREAVEKRVSAHLAEELMRRLPRDDQSRRAMLDRGQDLIKRMDWDHILDAKLLPLLRRVMSG